MVSQHIFQDKKEIARLKTQRNLLLGYERPVIDKILKKKGSSSISVLDVGCNGGEKTVALFSSDNVKKVIGIEYNKSLAEEAERERGNDIFSFFNLDVENSDFLPQLKGIMEKEGVKGFDIIYLSFVLMHLKNPESLLLKLKKLLKDDGTLVVVEPDDSLSFLCPDDDELLEGFMEILDEDKYSGNRRLGRKIVKILIDCGYQVALPLYSIKCEFSEKQKKDDVYTVFFSYLEDDIAILMKEDENNEEYKAMSRWLEENMPTLERIIKSDKSFISMGLRILTCTKGLEKNG